MKIRWTKSDGGENWASYNGYVGDRLRFHIVGERFNGKVRAWSLRDVQNHKDFDERQLLSGAKSIAQMTVDREQVNIDLARSL